MGGPSPVPMRRLNGGTDATPTVARAPPYGGTGATPVSSHSLIFSGLYKL